MNVNIIAHRGWWKTPEEQNSMAAFARAFDAGFGIELDVRDYTGHLVVSHDPVSADLTKPAVWYFGEVLRLLGDRTNTIAVNVKSCGLAPWFAKLKPPANWFFFDIAASELDEYRTLKLPYFVRCDRNHSVQYSSASVESRGVWYDMHPRFCIPTTLPNGPDQQVAFVSPELRGGKATNFWHDLKTSFDRNFILCTDFPQEARGYFSAE